jgi:methylated-DNA-[protein]-cysteine S-methyltransferase
MFVLNTKYGNIGIAVTSKGVTGISLQIKSRRGEDIKKTADNNVKKVASLLGSYFRRENIDFKVKYDISNLSNFTQKVLNETKKIPYGKTVTYSEIAKRIGYPKASRAVGQALGSNPIPIVIPCHRVIKKDKSLGGFSAGLKWKKMLLDLESGK